MPNHNQASFIGHIGKDAIKKESKSGDQTWAEFSIGIQDRNRETMWVNCKVFGRASDNAVNFCKKGAAVFVTGRIQVRAYIAKDGQARPEISLICSEWQVLSKVESVNIPPVNLPDTAFETSASPMSLDDLPF